MVKKIKRFIVLCLFSFLFSLIGGKVSKQHPKETTQESNEGSWMSAEAKCCPQGSVELDKLGNCINGIGMIVDEACYN